MSKIIKNNENNENNKSKIKNNKIKEFFNFIIQYIKKDLQLDEIKNLFNRNNYHNYEKIQNTAQKLLSISKTEINELNDIEQLLSKEFITNAFNNFEEIKCSKDHEFCFLLADDNKNAIKLMKNDFNYIFKKSSLIESEICDPNLINERDKFAKKLNNLDYEMILVQGEEAPCRILKSLEKELNVDYAMLDIIFGGIFIYKNKTYFFDGIDVAEYILRKNPKAVILFYTGCNLTKNSDEYNKLQKLIQKHEDQIFITDKDINDEVRIKTILESLKKFYDLHFKD